METLRENWAWFLGLGILLIVLGLAAVAAPVVATLAVEVVLGWLLLIGGVGQLVHAFRVRRWGGFLLQLLGAAVFFAVGALMVLFPFQGALAVTMLLAAFLLVQGVFQIVLAFRIRSVRNWGWTLASGIVGVVLGLLIWAQWPSSALWVLGVFVGLYLIFSGWALITLALTARPRRRREEAPGAGLEP